MANIPWAWRVDIKQTISAHGICEIDRVFRWLIKLLMTSNLRLDIFITHSKKVKQSNLKKI